jgi:hypothetical protein
MRMAKVAGALLLLGCAPTIWCRLFFQVCGVCGSPSSDSPIERCFVHTLQTCSAPVERDSLAPFF